MNGPEWASGCEHCSYGIKAAMPLTGVTNIMTERIVQMDMGIVEFCDCQAGQAYKRNVTAQRDKLIDEACKHPKMSQQARRASHPDIDNARVAMMAAQPEPTFNGEKVTA